MSGTVLEYSVDERVATLLLNRPDKRNALSGELIDALGDGLGRAERDASVRVVLIRGAGKDFCSGADLEELERSAEMGHEESVREATRLGDLFVNMRRHGRPIVAAVHGRALAGGAGLATACDLVLASEDAEFGYPEVHLGFVPAMVMTILRRKVPEALAFELVTRGDRISAGRAAEIGLVNRVFPTEGFDEAVHEYVMELASRPPSSVALSKELLYAIDGVGFEDGISMGAEVNAVARQTEECREGVRRFLDRAK
ncbi:MAG: enoyl-CoA hydratase-related protein [Gemmatimonadota bacterium]|nr:MAG: enoyl-CoA hydratase-related protein [Gemmatimonadota bacterium]